jgi:hypothetical protein
METAPRRIDPFTAELPGFSVDWRFLLPVRPGARMLVLAEAGADFAQYFSGLELTVVTARPGEAGDLRDRYDIVAIPLGIKSSHLQPSLARLLKPGGLLLIGFRNRWGVRKRSSPRTGAFTRRGLQRALERAGFREMAVYGAVPDLAKPEYILPLRKQALSFFLHHRYPGRRAAALLRLTSLPFFFALLSRTLPCYFMLASGAAA